MATGNELIAMNQVAEKVSDKVQKRMVVCPNDGTFSLEINEYTCPTCGGTVIDENNHEKFHRLAGKRVQNVLRAIELLGNCANPGYEYNDNDLAKMFGAISNALETVSARFNGATIEKDKFSF